VIPTLDTARLRLRPMTADDFPAYAARSCRTAPGRWAGRYDLRGAWGMFCHDVAGWPLFGMGALMADRRDTGETVGQVGNNGSAVPGDGTRPGPRGARLRHRTRLVSYVHPDNRASTCRTGPPRGVSPSTACGPPGRGMMAPPPRRRPRAAARLGRFWGLFCHDAAGWELYGGPRRDTLVSYMDPKATPTAPRPAWPNASAASARCPTRAPAAPGPENEGDLVFRHAREAAHDPASGRHPRPRDRAPDAPRPRPAGLGRVSRLHPVRPRRLRPLRPDLDEGKVWRAYGHVVGHWVLRGFGSFVYCLKGTDRAIGHCGPWFPAGWPEREIGWTVWDAAAEGKGFAFEAARATVPTPSAISAGTPPSATSTPPTPAPSRWPNGWAPGATPAPPEQAGHLVYRHPRPEIPA
jgi:hypothetical protein